jgi:hypothetical protein
MNIRIEYESIESTRKQKHDTSIESPSRGD